MSDKTRNSQSSLLTRLIKYFARQSKPRLIVFSYLMVCFIGIIDYLTGAEIAFSIFYVVPVAAATLSANRKHGLIISSVAGAVWLAADLLAKHAYSHPIIPWWNAAVRFFFFAVITNLASALKKMYEHEESLARTDALTGTANRRLLFETAQMRFVGPDANDRAFTTVYLDLDNFKKINDDHGHAAGDTILQSVGEIIKQSLRKTDIVARVGGDEFVILLPAAGAEDSKRVVNKIRNKITELASKEKLPLTITMGVATFLKPPKSVDEMISKADNLMYQAKEAGKNTTKYAIWNS
jgi:diguanylate cyclase (GGDEF)-like protein